MTPSLVLEPPAVATAADIDTAVELARRLGRPTLVSRTAILPFTPDLLTFLEAGSQALGHGVFWEQRASDIAFAGAGAAAVVTAQGSGRFRSVTAAIGDLAGRLVRDDESAVFPLIGGFAFSPRTDASAVWRDFPDAQFVVPRACLQTAASGALLRVTTRVDPDASGAAIDGALGATLEQAREWARASLPPLPRPGVFGRNAVPERRSWESSVADAVSMIRHGQLEKVVLAREERLILDRVAMPVPVLARLRQADPGATCFALQSGSSWFIGATPERLVRLDNGRVDVTCLAGSVAIGRDERESELLAARLLASAKDREEHAIVVRSTMQALEEVCEDVVAASGSPRVVQARSVQHLETPVTARMPRAGRVLDLVERLHPTPAVGGFPRAEALSVIRRLEAFDRGWYAAPVGWTDLGGNGEFAVAIRSALLSGRTASLFAGGGIVPDSDPAAEWDETCLKLRPMLGALGIA